MDVKINIALLLICCVCLHLIAVDARNTRTVYEEVLLRKLFSDYTKELAPNAADDDPVVVKHSLTIENLISWKDNILTLRLVEQILWTDPRLKWDPEAFNGIKIIRIPSKLFWQPDIVLYNSKDAYTGFASGDLNGVLTYSGLLQFVPPRITNTFCGINKDLEQNGTGTTCTLKYGSWTRTAQELDLQLQDQPRMTSAYSNMQWNITNLSATRNEAEYDCCPEKYIDIEYHITVKRSINK